MMNIASSVPSYLSGLSGLVRAKNSLTGQKKDKSFGSLGESVRAVRGKSYYLTCAHPRARKSGGVFSFKNPLGSLVLTGQAGQKKKGVDFAFILAVRAVDFQPDKPGQPGQQREIKRSWVLPGLNPMRAGKRPINA